MLSEKGGANSFKQRDRQSELYKKALSALALLWAEEGLDAVERATASVLRTARQDSLKENWKPFTSAPCLVRVGDGRHNCRYDCTPLPGADHTEMVKDKKTGRFLYKSEPYYINWRSLKEMVSTCSEMGLTAAIDARLSTHFPNSTVAVIVSKPA